MYLKLKDIAKPMKVVYTLREKLKKKPEYVAQVQAMTPEQRRELVQQRRAMLEQLSPQERAALREKLPTR